MRVLATYNIKGGVGKTAAAVNLGWLAAQGGARTLVWDLDPQGAATFYFRIGTEAKSGRRLVRGKRELDELVKGTDWPGLDMVPADFSYRHLDRLLDEGKKPTRRLQELLKPLADEYDVVVLDCPPSISRVSENVFRAAEALVVPIIPTTLSLRTLDQLTRFREEQELEHLKLLPFFSMVDGRKRLHRETMDELRAARGDILATMIPYASDIEQMGLRRAPVGGFAPRSRSAEAYAALWREVAARLGVAA